MKPRRVLVAQELGGNWGHRANVHRLVGALRAAGFAVVEESGARRPAPKSEARAPVSFADILDGQGFSRVDSLRELASFWAGRFQQAGADVVIAEYAPGALFAARLAGIPALQVATGFASPAHASPLVPFRPAAAPELRRLRALEARLLEAMNAVLRGSAAPPLRRVADLFDRGNLLLATFPELDHYGARRGARYIGPIFEDAEGSAPAWPAGDGARVFVYLRPAPCVPGLLEALDKCAARVLGVMPGGPAGFHREPLALGRLDPAPQFAVTYCGHGTTAALLLRGVPLLMIPNYVEQLLVARRVARLGAGIVLAPDATRSDIARAIAAIQTPVYAHAAHDFAARHAGYRPEHAIEAVVSTLGSIPMRHAA